MSELDIDATRSHVERVWEDEIVPALLRYIAIPNRSPLFDPEWEAAGHMERAVSLIADWCRGRAVPGLQLEPRGRFWAVGVPGRLRLVESSRRERSGPTHWRPPR